MRKKQIETFFRCKGIADGAKTLEEVAVMMEAAAAGIRQMIADGGELDDEVVDDYATVFVTTNDPAVAKKYEFTEA